MVGVAPLTFSATSGDGSPMRTDVTDDRAATRCCAAKELLPTGAKKAALFTQDTDTDTNEELDGGRGAGEGGLGSQKCGCGG